jgi:hypothetical protein
VWQEGVSLSGKKWNPSVPVKSSLSLSLLDLQQMGGGGGGGESFDDEKRFTKPFKFKITRPQLKKKF